MDADHASFQATSAFSGTGYTTQEAEFALNHPQRRHIIQDLIRFGGAGIITTMATMVGALVSSPDILKSVMGGEDVFTWLPLNPAEMMLIAIVIVVFWVYRLLGKPSVKRLIKEVVTQWLLEGNIVSPVQYKEHVIQPNGYAVIQVDICERNPMLGKTLEQIELSEKGIKVLSIERINETTTLLSPSPQTQLRLWDRVLFYGPVQSITRTCFASQSRDSGASEKRLKEDDPLPIGSIAPDFILNDQHNQPFRLSERRGKRNVIMVFYPKDNSSTCTSQLHRFNAHLTELDSLDADVVALNQESLKSHQQFAQQLHLRYPMLVDAGKKVCKTYRSLMLGGLLVNRTVYIIDRDGVIRFARRGNPDLYEIIGALRKIQNPSAPDLHLDENDGAFCPT